jgi:hypothetical protein
MITRLQFWSLTPEQRGQQLAEWLETHTIMGGAPDPSFDQLSATTLAQMPKDAVHGSV